MGTLHQAIVSLLEERVPVTNLTRILETILAAAPQAKDPLILADRVREQLGRDICDRFRDGEGRVRVIVLDPRLEMSLRQQMHENVLALQPAQLERLVTRLSAEWQKGSVAGREACRIAWHLLRTFFAPSHGYRAHYGIWPTHRPA